SPAPDPPPVPPPPRACPRPPPGFCAEGFCAGFCAGAFCAIGFCAGFCAESLGAGGFWVCSGAVAGADWATLPVGTAVVRKIRSPQITGVEKPRPGIAIFHLMFFVSLNSTGAAVRAIPLKKGPRHCGQWAGSEPAEPATRTTVVSAGIATRPPGAVNLFLISFAPAKSFWGSGLFHQASKAISNAPLILPVRGRRGGRFPLLLDIWVAI